jgi:signal transduction histidine kinase
VVCNVQQLQQVFDNLLVNAAHAIPTHGTVTVRTGTNANHVWIEISDTGAGMSEEVRKRIFEPFFTTRAVGKGTGLGLSVSWEIIQSHKGSIEVTSTPQVGSTFRITLPMQRQ